MYVAGGMRRENLNSAITHSLAKSANSVTTDDQVLREMRTKQSKRMSPD